MSEATIKLADTPDGGFHVGVEFGQAGTNDRSPAHAMTHRFLQWLETQAKPQGPAMRMRADGTMAVDSPEG